ncbi:MAG: hypothetical protein K2M07_05230 [Muribaculaceae bacterium]|nr:hypothetical protein [Muribaculaceae bacterium]
MFNTAYKTWLDCQQMRSRRERFKKYTYGRQWDDIVYDPVSCRNRPEHEIVENTGRSPITNNVIRQLVKTIVGKFRNDSVSPEDERLLEVYRRNLLPELDSRLLEEFLISGVAVQRITRECRRPGIMETFVDNVNPADFFINAIRDPRGWDVEIIGELRDMSIGELLMRYGKGDRDSIDRLRHIYSDPSNSSLNGSILGNPSGHRFFESPTGRCRVIEVWSLEMDERIRCHDTHLHRCFELPASQSERVDAENKKRLTNGKSPIRTRMANKPTWICRVYAPDGTLINEHPSFAPHGEHPYVVKLYPLTDGEIHPFVEDVIDQQRHINRLITMIDHIMGVSAKGVLLFPTEAKIDQLSWGDISHQWSTCGGIIPYRSLGSSKQPTQITSGGLDAGASKLVELQMKLIQEVSGVNDAISGKNIASGVGADRYQQQVQNATVALLDLMETFKSLLNLRDRKILLA